MHLMSTKIIESNREVCIISDHHRRILNKIIFYFMLIYLDGYVCKIRRCTIQILSIFLNLFLSVS
jgi:hypothetical protein